MRASERGGRHRRSGPASAWISSLGGAGLLLVAGCGAREPAERPAEVPEAIEDGLPAEAELGPEEVHRYRLPLERDRFLRLTVEQLGVDAEISLHDPGGRSLILADRQIFDRGEELLLVVVESSGVHTLSVRGRPDFGAGRYRARIEELRPASERDRLAAATYRRFREGVALQGESPEEAMAIWSDVLATWRGLGEPALEGEVLARMGADAFNRRRFDRSAAYSRQALDAFRRAGERYEQAVLHQGFASMLLQQGEAEEALDHYRSAVALARELEASYAEASALYGMGALYHRRGEIQEALSHYEEALARLPAADTLIRPYTLHNLGVLYSLYFGDDERGRELLAAARDLWPESAAFQEWKARTLAQLARIARGSGRPEEARTHLRQALAIPEGYDRCGRASALASLALLEEADGASRSADRRLAEAFERLDEAPCPRSEVTVRLDAGDLGASRGEPGKALAAYERARALAEAQGDRTRLAESLVAIARTRRALGRSEEALEASGRALAILEEVRPTVLREDLRTSFFATTQDGFDLHIGLLSALGLEEEAWLAAERARAQALQDLLLEAGAGLRRGADPRLVERERKLQAEIQLLEARRREVFREPTAEKLRSRQREIDALVEELERIRGEIRRQSPAYAALTTPEPLSLARAQRDLLDDDVLLLEYRLGEEASWLWAITRDSFRIVTLPPRAEIESVAQEAVRSTRSLRWPERNPPAVCELARLVLGPVAAELGSHRRLVVVADGALEAVSFAALPDPAGSRAPASYPEARPLVAGHELVYLPSVAALATQRRLLAAREPAPGWLAVVADPVYGSDDERLRRPGAPRPASFLDSPAEGFRRLRHAGAEAEAILARLPAGRRLASTGFEASRETVTGGGLGGFRVLHFATHGVLHPDQPLLSFLALSGRNRRGEPVDGALYAHEIYDIDLPAELVVLSACETALGRQLRGEGLVSGLPRAFLYAGAARVLVSLWAVEDRSTGVLMDRFYRGLVDGGLPPGRALQEAQRSLWREGHPPYRWAGFVLQGDWRPLPPFTP
jgi:CHAT domain-containing protein/tetratricopeptide (TPR) repeat protein